MRGAMQPPGNLTLSANRCALRAVRSIETAKPEGHVVLLTTPGTGKEGLRCCPEP